MWSDLRTDTLCADLCRLQVAFPTLPLYEMMAYFILSVTRLSRVVSHNTNVCLNL